MSDEQSETTGEPVKKHKGGRPRKVAAPALSEDQFAKLLEVLAAGRQSGGGIDADMLQAALSGAAQVSAQAMKKAMKPENESHPGISAFSYPEGDVKRPKIAPPFEFLYNRYPCSKFLETEHWRECELMAQVKAGEYTVIRSDGSLMRVTVKADVDANGVPTRMEVEFPVSREDKNLIPPKAAVLYQIVHAGEKSPRQLFVEAMTDWLTIVHGDPVAA